MCLALSGFASMSINANIDFALNRPSSICSDIPGNIQSLNTDQMINLANQEICNKEFQVNCKATKKCDLYHVQLPRVLIRSILVLLDSNGAGCLWVWSQRSRYRRSRFLQYARLVGSRIPDSILKIVKNIRGALRECLAFRDYNSTRNMDLSFTVTLSHTIYLDNVR